ncbi:tetratricopeptide repeat protein [Corallococcus sp. EGB]|uniref:tetratricopeptide repeat protein n=1 Tax=Corallococcus sp. EGB TaxID=1521117 RepID=UPI001CBD064C|nr:tetratricopeptide repeat protein [Corallococcus sp. EGB]
MLRSILGLCCSLVLLVPARAPALTQEPLLRIEEKVIEPEPDPSTFQATEEDPETDTAEDAHEPEPEPRPDTRRRVIAPPPVKPAAPVTPEAPPVVVPPRPAVTPVMAPKVTDADLLGVWERWKAARSRNDLAAAEAAQKELLTLRQEVLATDLEPLSMGFVREAAVRRRAGDLAGALALLDVAVTLSPGLPAARFARAETYVVEDPLNVPRAVGEWKDALVTLAGDARYRRPALTDLGALVLAAWAATAVAVVAVLFLRRIRYALHDFHHFFPRAVTRWQSGLLGLVLLALPAVLGAGLVPVLLVLFASVALYVGRAERWVAAVLLMGLGVMPLAAGTLARLTVFAGTPAEDVYLLERGGLSAEGAAARVRARAQARTARFQELGALAYYESRRGLLEEARTAFKAATALKEGDARMLTRFGNALLGLGDEEGAVLLYTQASRADPSMAAPHYNLGQVYRRRARLLPDDQVGKELDRSTSAIAQAQALDKELIRREPPPEDRPVLNLLLLSPTVPESAWMALADGTEEGARVESQVGRWLSPVLPAGPVGWGLTAALAALAAVFGEAAWRMKASRGCERCGQAVCLRCDKDLSVGSAMCGQCVHVFARKSQVPKEFRSRKQGEVDRHKAWTTRVTYALGSLMSGAGHVGTGLPVRGALYAFVFSFALAALVLHRGLVRTPYGDAPLYLKLVPAGTVLFFVYLLTLRGLRRHQRGEA